MFARTGLSAYVSATRVCARVPGASMADDLAMTDRQDDGEGAHVVPQDPRRERLKQALRENLKRRKSQIRERGKPAPAPATRHETERDENAADGANNRT